MKCRLCYNVHQDQIVKDYAAGLSQSEIATRWGVSQATASRHARHIRKPTEIARDAPGVTRAAVPYDDNPDALPVPLVAIDARSLVTRLQEVVSMSRHIMLDCYHDDDMPGALRAIDTLTRILSMLVKTDLDLRELGVKEDLTKTHQELCRRLDGKLYKLDYSEVKALREVIDQIFGPEQKAENEESEEE